MPSLTRLWMCLFFFLVVQTFFFFFFLPPSRSPFTQTLAPSASSSPKLASLRWTPWQMRRDWFWHCSSSCWRVSAVTCEQVPSIWLSQMRMCGQLYQKIFDQFTHLILIKIIMLQRTFARLLRITSRTNQYSFSSTQKPEQQKNESQEQPSTSKTQEERQRRDGEDDVADDDVPFEKENRNTVGWWIYRFFFWGSVGLLSYNVYLVYGHNKKTPVENETGAVPYVIDAAKGIVNQINDITEFITQPPSKKLLADPVHPDFHPKTLVLNLTGTLVKSEYIFGKGNKTIVRPGLDHFLQRLISKYEIIIFAEEDSALIQNSMNSVDPKHRYISSFFGKESMVWRNGGYVKDLKYLNRDLRKVIVVDRIKDNVKNQPENVILLPEFDGNKDDHQLAKLVALLERLAGPDVPDVRKELSALGEDPVNNFIQKRKEKQKKLQQKSGVFGIFGGNPNKKPSKESDL